MRASRLGPSLSDSRPWIYLLITILFPSTSSSDRKIDSSHFIDNLIDHTYRAVINRKLLPPGEGFHLEIVTEFALASPLISGASSSSALNCSLRLTETLPSSLYVDAFQLENYRQFGGPRVEAEDGVVVDTEAPAFESRSHRLFVYQRLRPNVERQRLVARTIVPVHLRYHRAVDGGEPTSVIFGDPDTHVSCWNGDANLKREKSDWLRIETEAGTEPVTIAIPRGDSRYGPLVIVATLIACAWAFAQIWSATSVDYGMKDD